MKENRNAVYITMALTITSFMCAAIISYNYEVYNMFINPEFIVNCMLGIFTGAFLSLIISVINYSVMKKRALTEYANFINCLNILIIPIYNLFKGGERNIEYEVSIISAIYDMIMENLHMKPHELFFIFPHTKIEKQIVNMDQMVIELYKKILNLKQLINKQKFGLISSKELADDIEELFTYLRNYDDGEIYTNILSREHRKLLKLANLKYEYDAKINF